MAKKIIALASEPISADVLRAAVGKQAAEEAEVLVIAPALNSKVRFWVSDPDPAIHKAQGVADESAERLDDEHIDAVGETGDSDPLQALQDALVTFPADAIVLCTHPGGERNWLEDGVVDDARERFGGDREVTHIELETD
jgi:hypothetical protein